MPVPLPTSLCTPDAVKAQMLGLVPLLNAVVRLGVDPDPILQAAADARVAELEQSRGTFLTPRRIKTFPAPTDVLGVDYDLSESQYDLMAGYRDLGYFQLRHRPVQSVQRVAVELDAQNTILTYPASWLRVNREMGTLSVVPVMGPSLSDGLALSGGYYLPSLSGGALGGVMPSVVSIDYTAGIPDAATNPRWAHLRLALAQGAAVTARAALWEMVPQSHSLDGISDTFGATAQVAEMHQRAWDRFVANFNDQNAPILVAFA